MSSSIFIESNSLPNSCISDSNLVVVYGKNGIHFDDKGLENLIVYEKKMSSISVIRLTSPTPSMEEEEASLEETKIRQEFESVENSSCQEDGSILSDDDKNNTPRTDDISDDDEERKDQHNIYGSEGKSFEQSKAANKIIPLRRNRLHKSGKQTNVKRKHKRERPEVVGLRFEEFYSTDNANEIIMEALKMAGLGPDRKSKEYYELQLNIIRNDHCYTPFTSPTQMKAKLAAEKLEIEKQFNNRNVTPPLTVTEKALFIRKKTQKTAENVGKFAMSPLSTKKKSNISLISRIRKECEDIKSEAEDYRADDGTSTDEYEDSKSDIKENESECPSSEESDESDNDRDSDLDFDVNNPKGRKRKIKSAKTSKRLVTISKIQQKSRCVPSQDEQAQSIHKPSTIISTATIQRNKSLLKNISDTGRVTIRSTPTKIVHVGSGTQTKVLSSITAAAPPIKKINEIKLLTTPITTCVTQTSMLQKSANSSHTVTSQPHKEILIHRQIMSRPKTKGFTDLNVLMEQREKKASVPILTPKSYDIAADCPIIPMKCFMPLGVETAAKNQLPAQISIQMHQSSSELEAEHDKQLDLINSIVEDVLQKSNEILTPAGNIENIPELVKMLERTERESIASKEDECNPGKIRNNQHCENSKFEDSLQSKINNRPITDVDISNDSLLATTDTNDDLPDDILQQVVDLIKDDKTLQEAVEVLGKGDCNDSMRTSSCMTIQNPPPLTPISHLANNINELEDTPHSSNSIIQLCISNESLPTATSRTTIIPNRTTPYQAIKTSPNIRKEPIQIVRGNGRVITLPPIEAPTTRAKRRAQVQPSTLPCVASTSLGAPISGIVLHNSGHSNPPIMPTGGSGNTVPESRSPDNTYRRRASKESITTTKTISNQKTKRNNGNKKGNISNNEADAADDDDPNKLWCICRQPHNNRFMICCDACEDWFHGTCVNITKAMGLEMEQKGIDWTCPKCVKKHEEKKQAKIADLLIMKPVNTVVQPSEVHPIPPGNSTEIIPSASVAVATSNIRQGPTQEKPTESNQSLTESPKPKLQTGQFINIKDLRSMGKKVIIQSASSCVGQNKIIVTTAQPLRAPSIRTFTVVKQISPATQAQNQNIKVIKTISPAQSTVRNISASNISNNATFNDSSTSCIVCKKIARLNSIYCSDDCIRKHAQSAWNIFVTKSQTEMAIQGSPLNKVSPDDKAKKKSKGLFEHLLSMADRKPKMERVNVFERKSGRILSGSCAPTFSNLKKWLQDNPTFEVIQPGSVQAVDIEKKQKVRNLNSSSSPILKSTTSPPPLKMLPLSSSIQQKPQTKSESPQTQAPIIAKYVPNQQPKANRSLPMDLINNSPTYTNPRLGITKHLKKNPHFGMMKADKILKDIKLAKEKPGTAKRATTEVGNKSTGDSSDIRLVVQRTLKEQLIQRIQDENFSCSLTSESNDTKTTDICNISPEDIEEFAKSTELEMYNYFNHDTGVKYKAKYRSLVFNIKDRKNHTLFAKICGKLIQPKQLVRMSPEEMASQELAQWREQETKHQLEIIKKSELDLLSCVKNYVLKTHKGEEVIEGKSSEYENQDIIIPVEDVQNRFNFTIEATATKSHANWPNIDWLPVSHSNMSEMISQTEKIFDEEKFISLNTQNKEKEREREKEKDKHRYRERERDKRHKSKDRYRNKSRSRKRSRSYSRSLSRDHNEKRSKNSHKEGDREKDRHKDRPEREHQGDNSVKKVLMDKKSLNTSKSRETFSIKKQTQDHNPNPLKSYNLIDQIIESSKTVEEAANLIFDRNNDNIDNVRKTSVTLLTPCITSTTTTNSDLSSAIDIPVPPSYVENDQEPSSTVSIPTPPHDPYARFNSLDSLYEDSSHNVSNLWTGNINMVDVTSFHLLLQPAMGNCNGLCKLLPKELDVVGRIGPETVWDYISKIKKSPNKEIVMTRLLPACETETAAYKLLFEYLDNRKRLGVIKSVSPFIKDFYVYPLGAGRQMPIVLRPTESVEFYDDPLRPDLLIGIIVRVVAKRHNTVAVQPSAGVNDTFVASSQLLNRTNDDSHTPPGSPKLKKRRQSIAAKEIDVDAIIKAPIVSKSHKVSTTAQMLPILKDADEPYSPGGSSDDDLPLLPVKLPTGSNQMQSAEEELKRKMEEINRQIAAQEMEIAGLLTGETTKFGNKSASTSKVLANIAIPSNLSQILASIKPTMTAPEVQTAVPPPPPLIGSLIKTSSTLPAVDEYNTCTTPSRLGKLSEAELLSMVPDDIVITPKTTALRYEEPPPPGV